MLFAKSRLNTPIIVAVLAVATRSARSAAPRREPDVPFDVPSGAQDL